MTNFVQTTFLGLQRKVRQKSLIRNEIRQSMRRKQRRTLL